MASRSSTNLGGLPDIGTGGINVDEILKIATFFNQMNEQEAKYGKSGTPPVIRKGTPEIPYSEGTPASGGDLLVKAPFLNPVRRLLGGGATPVRRIEDVPSDLSSAQPGAFDQLLSGGTAYVRGGTPGTPATPFQAATPDEILSPGTPGTVGTEELRNKAGILNLLDPDSADKALTTRGYEGLKVKRDSDSALAFNPQTGELRDTEGDGFYFLKKADAVKESAGYFGRKMAASAQGQADVLRAFAELNDIPIHRRTTGQKATLRALDIVLPEKLGIETFTKLQQQIIANETADYKASKTNLLNSVARIKANKTLKGKDKDARISGAIEDFKNAYKGTDYFDFYPPDEKKLKKR